MSDENRAQETPAEMNHTVAGPAQLETPATPTPRLQSVSEPQTPLPRSDGEPEDAAMDALVNQLAAMFPSLDKGVVEDVLESERGSADSAVPLLLMLSGQGDAIKLPSQDANPNVPQKTPDSKAAQLAQDEAIARQLAEEEYHAQSREQLHYQPRQARPRPTEQVPDESEDKDEFDQVVAQVKNAADSAKKMGITIFNRLSSRIKDYSAGEGSSTSATTPQNETTSFRQQNETPSLPPKAPAPNRTGSLFSRATPAQPIPATSQRVAPPLPHASRYAKVPTSPPSQPTFDATSEKPAQRPEDSSSGQGQSPNQIRNSLGEYPRQKINLLDNSTGQRRPLDDDSDDESLEYEKNPFDD